MPSNSHIPRSNRLSVLHLPSILVLCIIFCSLRVLATERVEHVEHVEQATSDPDKGRCVELRLADTYSSDILFGFSQGSCHSILLSAGYTHFWVNKNQIPDGNTDGPCLQESVFVIDAPIRQVGNIFTATDPSPICQKSLAAALCLGHFRRCDPRLDTPSNGYLTNQKPCKWLCDVTREFSYDGVSDVTVCSADDRQYLAKFGIDLAGQKAASGDTIEGQPPITPNGLSVLDCESSIWSTDDESCILPDMLLSRTIAPTCQVYTGTACSHIFTSGTLIYLPPGVTVAEIEQHTDFSAVMSGLPLADRSCTHLMSRQICTLLFPECVQQSLTLFVTHIATNVTTEEPRHFPIPLLSSTTTCQEYLEGCQNTPLFQTISPGSPLRPTSCVNYNSLRRSQCFPIKDVSQGIDATPPIDDNDNNNDDNDYNFFKTLKLPTNRVNTARNLKQNAIVTSKKKTEITPTYVDPALFSGKIPFNGTLTPHTMAQIQLINHVNDVYGFNSLLFVQPYQYDSIHFKGPETSTTKVFISGETYSATEFYINPAGQLPFTPICPYPLYNDPTPYNHGSGNVFKGQCAVVACPNPIFSEQDKFDIEVGSIVMVSIAMVFSGILALSFLVFKSQSHKWILARYTLSYFGVSIAMFQGLMSRTGLGSTYNNQCDASNPTQLQHGTGFGLYTSILLVFFLIASSAWWVSLTIDLFQRLILGHVYRRGSRAYKERRYVLTIFGWGVPAICTVGMVTADQLGYDGTLPFAFIAFAPNMTSTPISVSWWFLFLPILILAVTGFSLIGVIVFYLIRYEPTDQLKKFNDQMEDRHAGLVIKLKNVIKLFGFVLLMILFIILLIVNQVYMEGNRSKWARQLMSWAEIYLMVGDPEILPISGQISPTRVLLTVFGFCSPGFVMFVLYFLSSSDLYKLWFGLLSKYFPCCKCLSKWAKEDTITGSNNDGSYSDDSTNNSNKSTNQDIFTALTHEALRGKKGKEESAAAQSDATATNDATTQANNNLVSNLTLVLNSGEGDGSRGPISPQNSTPSTSLRLMSFGPQRQDKRTKLFRGFENNQVGGGSALRNGRSPSVTRSSSRAMGSEPDEAYYPRVRSIPDRDEYNNDDAD
jgi:hypothetical protein